MTDYDSETGEVRGLPMTAEPPRARNLIFASPSCAEVFGALCDFQGECEAPSKTKKAKVKGTTRNGSNYEYEYAYAPLDEIHRVIKEPLTKAGLSRRQFLAVVGDQWVVRTIIAHKSGEWYGCDYPLFWDQSRGMQGFASGATYARRYGLMLALGIVAEDDDDANVADGQPATISNTGRSGGRTAQEATRGHQSPVSANSAPAATTSDEDAARAAWRKVSASIDEADTLPDLDNIAQFDQISGRPIGNAAWTTAHDLTVKTAGRDTADLTAENMFKKLERRRGAIKLRIDETADLPI